MDPRVIPSFEFLRWYGLLWAIGIFLGYQLMSTIYRKENLSDPDLDKLVLYVMLGAILGARIGHILFYDPIHYINNPIEILPVKLEPHFQFTGLAGLASHGGVIGALIALYLYDRKYQKGYLWLLDRLIIAGSLLGGFIRLGNLLNSEIIGLPTKLPWAFVFIRVDHIPRHPSQLYESFFYFLISIILFFLWKSGKVANHRGLLFGLGLTSIFIIRFAVEFIKEDQVAFEGGLLLNMGQTLSIPFILIGVSFIALSIKRATTSGSSFSRLKRRL